MCVCVCIYVYTMNYYLAMKKNEITNYLQQTDGLRDYHVK